MSTYVVSRPHIPYGDQVYFTQKMDEAEAAVVESIQKAVVAKEDLIALFHKTLAYLDNARLQIAQHEKKGDENLFGVRRDRADGKNPYYLTPMGAPPYDEYGKRLISFLQGHLKKLPHTLQEFKPTAITLEDELCLGRAFSTHIAVLSGDNAREWAIKTTFEEYERYCQLCETPYILMLGLKPIEHFDRLMLSQAAMQKLKAKAPEEYKKLKISLAIHKLRTLFPDSKKSEWVIVTRRMQVGKQMVAISQYITWMYRDFKEDPVEHMTGHSIVSIFHQDPFLIPLMLDDIAKLFKEAVEWNHTHLAELKDRMILFEKELSEATHCLRGSAAICERFVSAIYRFQSYKLLYNQNKLTNLEALTSSLKEFKDNYDAMVQLEPIEKSAT